MMSTAAVLRQTVPRRAKQLTTKFRVHASNDVKADSLGHGDQNDNPRLPDVGSEDAMAQVIEFYVPDRFRKKKVRWVPPEQRGKIIAFPIDVRKSA